MPQTPEGGSVSQPQWVARDKAVSRRVMSDGRISKVVDYFGGASPWDGPQAYLVTQRNYVSRAHFHPVDQFQVLYGAPGSLFGNRPIGDLSVHYADAYTVYGPLIGGDPPLRYFTLRAEPTTATEYMPQSRELLAGRRGRSLHTGVEPAPEAADGASTLLADERDGMRVVQLTGAPGARVTIPAAGAVGQFLFVTAGTALTGQGNCGPQSIGWQPPGAPAAEVTAGDEGVAVVALRYPHRADSDAPRGGQKESS